MKALDDADLFKYNPNKQRQEQQKPAYLSENIILFKYNSSTGQNENQGQFTFVLRPTNNAINFLVHKVGAAPIIDMPLIKTTNWNLQNKVFCYFKDAKNQQWLLQFPSAVAAARATAEIGLLLTCTTVKDVSYFDSFVKPGKALSLGDTVRMEYYGFEINTFPKIGNLFASDETLKATLQTSALSIGWVRGIVGMTCGSCRSIFVPMNMTATDTGAKDSSIPNKHLVFVTIVHNAKYKDEPKMRKSMPANRTPRDLMGQDSTTDEEPHKEVMRTPPRKPKIRTPSPLNSEPVVDLPIPDKKPPEPITGTSDNVPQQSDHSEISDHNASENPFSDVSDHQPKIEQERETEETISEPVSEQERETEEPEKEDFATKMARFKRMGTMGGIPGMPKPMGLRHRDPPPQEPKLEIVDDKEEEKEIEKAVEKDSPHKVEVTPTKSDTAEKVTPIKTETPKAQDKLISPQKVQTSYSQIAAIEQRICKKIDDMKSVKIGTPESIARGVSSMAAQFKAAEAEIETLKKQLEQAESKSGSGNALQKQIDEASKEAAEVKKRIAENERQIDAIEKQVMEKSKGRHIDGERAKAIATKTIKTMMDGVFQEMNDKFDDEMRYNGQDVMDDLMRILQKHAFAAMKGLDGAF